MIMKKEIGILIIIAIVLFGILFFVITSMFSDFASIQKCQRLTGMGWFECGELNKKEIDKL